MAPEHPGLSAGGRKSAYRLAGFVTRYALPEAMAAGSSSRIPDIAALPGRAAVTHPRRRLGLQAL